LTPGPFPGLVDREHLLRSDRARRDLLFVREPDDGLQRLAIACQTVGSGSSPTILRRLARTDRKGHTSTTRLSSPVRHSIDDPHKTAV
jgi:hypothetical protein